MNFDSLEKRIDKLLAFLEQPAEQRLEDIFPFDLLTPDEQVRFYAFFDTWSHRIPGLDEMTIEEKDLLESWLVLARALERGDTELAFRTRRYLLLSAQDKERIYHEFMAIDEQCFIELPMCSNAPIVRWDETNHYIYRRGFQSEKQHMQQYKARGGYWRRWEIDLMWLWLSRAQLAEVS